MVALEIYVPQPNKNLTHLLMETGELRRLIILPSCADYDSLDKHGNPNRVRKNARLIWIRSRVRHHAQPCGL